MRKKVRKENPVFKNIKITGVAAEGKAIAKIDEMVVFVAFGAPGDEVDIEIYRKKKNYMEGRILHFHAYSPFRTTPFCAHYGICGGCKWQHIRYEDQLQFKQQQVIDHLERIGKLKMPSNMPAIAGSEDHQFYRNKLEYTFAPKRWLTEAEMGEEFIFPPQALGFHLPGKFDKILDIEKCYLQADPSNAIRLHLKRYAIEHEIPFYNVKSGDGYLRNVIIRTTQKGECMLILIVKEDLPEHLYPILDSLALNFPQISSLMYVINPKANDSINDLEVHLYKGNPYLTETMPPLRENGHNLSFRIGPKSFYQTNAKQVFHLYKLACDMADLKGDELVYDLYTGTGTIANFVAPYVKKVVGVEYVPEAIEDAKINSLQNNIFNTVFYAGDMAKIFDDEFVVQNGHPDLVITDPPREGMHSKVVEQLLHLAPSKIIYISCNSATQARDLELLSTAYHFVKNQSVDMFPHTFHVENIAYLERIEKKAE